MAEWTETYRGTVAPWECDVTEHFTVAYYFDRIDQAAALLAARLGLGDSRAAGVFPRRLNLRFARELRAAASFHVASAPIGLDPALRLGHRVIDSAGGETVTWVEDIWEAPPAPSRPNGATRSAGSSRSGKRRRPRRGPSPKP